MSIYYQEKVTGVGGATIISANRANLARFRVEAGTIQTFDVWRDNFSPGSPVTFQLRINGVAQFITPPVLLTNSEHIGVTGLSFATADGDVVSIDASFEGSTEFGFRFPAYFRIGFDQAAASVSDAAYNATTWDGVTTTAPSKNAVRDKIEAIVASIAGLVDDTAYDATTWNGVTGVAPSKNAVRDKIEALIAYVDSAVSDTVYGSGWNGDTTTAPSKNAVYDKIETLSSGGGTGSGEPTGVLAPRRTPNAMDDDFEGNSLDTAKWTRTGTAGPIESYDDILRSSIFCRFTNASGTESLVLTQAFVPGSADFSVTVCGMLQLKSNFNDFYISLSDTGGTNQLTMEYVYGSARKITYWKNVSGSQTFDIVVVTPPVNDNAPPTTPAEFIMTHIQRVSGTYSLWYSYDGIHWNALQTSHTQTITVAKVSIGLAQNGSADKIFGAIHWFRKDWLFLS